MSALPIADTRGACNFRKMKSLSRPLVVLACSFSTSAFALDAQHTIRVPVAPPRVVITVEGGPEPIWTEPQIDQRNEIILVDPDGDGMLGASPSDGIYEAIDALAAALPADYLAMLMRAYGYEPGPRLGRWATSRRDDLRQYDLGSYLFETWVFRRPDSRLAREFSCLSPGERGITPFLALLTGHLFYASDGVYVQSTAGGAASLPLAAYTSANVAAHACRRLAEEEIAQAGR